MPITGAFQLTNALRTLHRQWFSCWVHWEGNGQATISLAFVMVKESVVVPTIFFYLGSAAKKNKRCYYLKARREQLGAVPLRLIITSYDKLPSGFAATNAAPIEHIDFLQHGRHSGRWTGGGKSTGEEHATTHSPTGTMPQM